MRPLDVCPTEDAIKAFLGCLIDPVLPTKSSSHDSPSLPQQQLVAKQVYAVAILYNYYHRKQWPELEFLDFLQFCKLAVLMRPTLLPYMKLMHIVDDADMYNPEIEPSVTESKIMTAYDICKRLDASRHIPNMETWPALTVAIFLVDFSKTNCFLVSDSLAQGVWSIIEKDFDVSNKTSVATPLGTKPIAIKKKIVRKRPTIDDSTIDEDALRRVAFLAVEEVAGIDQTDLSVLESHTVYSLTKEKAVSRFYIMQCKNRDENFRFPIKDILNRLQGPLISSIGLKWCVTPVVEYFYILPYAGILSAWFSREVSPDTDSFKKLKVESEIIDILDSKEAKSEPEIEDGRKISYPVNTTTGGMNKKKNDIGSVKCNEKQAAEFLSHDLTAYESMVADTIVNEVDKQVPSTVNDCQEKVMDDVEKGLNRVTAGFQAQSEPKIKDGRKRPYPVNTTTMGMNKKTNEIGSVSVKYLEKQSGEFPSHDLSVDERMVADTIVSEVDKQVPSVVDDCQKKVMDDLEKGDLNDCMVADTTVSEVDKQVPNVVQDCQEKTMDDIEKGDLNGVTVGFQECLTKCENENEETVPGDICKSISHVQFITDHASMHQLRSEEIDDVHAVLNPEGSDLCQTADKIHEVLNDKGNDVSQIAVRVILKQRAMLSLQLRNIEDEIAKCDEKLRKIAAGGDDSLELKLQCIKDGKSPCQELDEMCEKNNWILPTYHVSLCDEGGFIATVSMKGMEGFVEGEAECVPQKARESAAAHLLTKLVK